VISQREAARADGSDPPLGAQAVEADETQEVWIWKAPDSALDESRATRESARGVPLLDLRTYRDNTPGAARVCICLPGSCAIHIYSKHRSDRRN